MEKLIKRNEFERLTEEQSKEIALATISKNGFNAYIGKCDNGTFEELNCNIYFNGKYIDYITYPDYVNNIKGLENYIDYVNRQMDLKTYADDDLKDFKDYDDFRNKTDYIWNIMTQKYDCVSLYDDRVKTLDTNIYKYKCFMKLWRNLDEAQYCKDIYENLKKLYFKKIIADDELLYNACVSEFYNHESPIDYDGISPAMNALGINYKALPVEKRNVIDRAYKYVCRHGNW